MTSTTHLFSGIAGIFAPFPTLMGVGFLTAAWVLTRELEEEGCDAVRGLLLLPYAVVGGIVGAKLYFAIDTTLRTGESFGRLALSAAGMTWYGGLLGGALLVTLALAIHGLPLQPVARAMAIALPLGQMWGRIGCFLVGDDYGRATNLPWGVAFPFGVPPVFHPVHPTQLYEAAWLFVVAMVLWRRRLRSPSLFSEYLVLSGLGRFAIEALRVNAVLGLGLTQAQWFGLVMAGLGLVLGRLARRSFRDHRASSWQQIRNAG